MRSPEEAADYGRELQKIVKFIGVSDGAMADGR
jgi:Asp-tRNA(Asn)/Glu-tRNA(Gln) amidotransferase B subunit